MVAPVSDAWLLSAGRFTLSVHIKDIRPRSVTSSAAAVGDATRACALACREQLALFGGPERSGRSERGEAVPSVSLRTGGVRRTFDWDNRRA